MNLRKAKPLLALTLLAQDGLQQTAPSYTTQYPDLFITYNEGFNMHTRKSNRLQLPEDEHYYKLSTQLYSGKLVHYQNELFFASLKRLQHFCYYRL